MDGLKGAKVFLCQALTNWQQAAEIFVEFITLLSPPQFRILKPLIDAVMDYLKYFSLRRGLLTIELIINLLYNARKRH